VDRNITTPASEPVLSGLRAVPWWLINCVVVLLALPVLWAFSVPGLDVLSLLAGLWLWQVAGALWGLRLLAHVAWKRERSGWFAVAPVMVLVLIGLVSMNVPLKARWALSSASFDAAVAVLPPEPDFVRGPAEIGSYTITSVQRVPTGVIFTELHGAVFNSAGFAYLPAGPTPDLENGSFEGPQWTSLGGPWYSWTASW
jgi:hypothetical protein